MNNIKSWAQTLSKQLLSNGFKECNVMCFEAESTLSFLNNTSGLVANAWKMDPQRPFVIFLEGMLGSGKTQFVKFLCKKLDINQDEVKSPSFTRIDSHVIPGNGHLHHIDLYLSTPQNLPEICNIAQSGDIACIEWSCKLINNMISTLHADLTIKLDHCKGKRCRKVTITINPTKCSL